MFEIQHNETLPYIKWGFCEAAVPPPPPFLYDEG